MPRAPMGDRELREVHEGQFVNAKLGQTVWVCQHDHDKSRVRLTWGQSVRAGDRCCSKHEGCVWRKRADEGWGLVEGRYVPGYAGSGKGHYFRDRKSLCGTVTQDQVWMDRLHEKPVVQSCKRCLAARKRERLEVTTDNESSRDGGSA